MYSAQVVTLQTERGKELIKEYEDDAQCILADLHEYHITEICPSQRVGHFKAPC